MYNKKKWVIAFPGEFGQDVQETWTEDQILKSYWTYWATKMIDAGKGDLIDKKRCIDDWVTVHWAIELDSKNYQDFGSN